MGAFLTGRRILVVEDNFIMALDLSQMLEELGGAIVGPVGRLAAGLRLAQSHDLAAAILDVSLDGEDSFALADQLLARNIPIVFATGYDAEALPERFAGVPRLAKPFSIHSLEQAMRKLLG